MFFVLLQYNFKLYYEEKNWLSARLAHSSLLLELLIISGSLCHLKFDDCHFLSDEKSSVKTCLFVLFHIIASLSPDNDHYYKRGT